MTEKQKKWLEGAGWAVVGGLIQSGITYTDAGRVDWKTTAVVGLGFLLAYLRKAPLPDVPTCPTCGEDHSQ